MRLLHPIRLLGLMHHARRRVEVIDDGHSLNFLTQGYIQLQLGILFAPLGVGGLPNQPALVHYLTLLFHLYAVMKQPKLALARVIVSDMGSREAHGRSYRKTKRDALQREGTS